MIWAVECGRTGQYAEEEVGQECKEVKREVVKSKAKAEDWRGGVTKDAETNEGLMKEETNEELMKQGTNKTKKCELC